MSKHRRPSSGHLATLPSRGARTSGAALLGTVLAVGLVPVTAGAAFAQGSPSTCDATKPVDGAGKATGGSAKTTLVTVPDPTCKTPVVDDPSKGTGKDRSKGKDPSKGGHWGGKKDKDHDGEHGGTWRDRDHDGRDDADDEDDDESTDDASAEKTDKTDKTADTKTEVAAASDSTPTVVDVPAATTDTVGTSQVSSVPVGSVDAGDGSTADSHIGEALVGLGALGLAGAGAGAMVHRRRRSA